ncbi:hypothetical protein BHM03_00007298, partial [Ensete ventricosum]
REHMMARRVDSVGKLVTLALFFLHFVGGDAQSSAALVPAIITFGDSTVDVGNNDYLKTFFRADCPPYGRDFKNHQPTGRFCNGKLATDLTGRLHAIPLSQQLEYYKEYQSKLAHVAGSSQAKSIISDALYIVSTGASDFIQNYYINPFLFKTQSPDQYSSFLVDIFSNFVKVSSVICHLQDASSYLWSFMSSSSYAEFVWLRCSKDRRDILATAGLPSCNDHALWTWQQPMRDEAQLRCAEL